MKVQVVCMIVACTVMVDGQTGSSPARKADEKQPAARCVSIRMRHRA